MKPAVRTPREALAACRLVFGEVRHTRLSPVHRAFRYRSFYVRMPATLLDGPACGNALFGINRRALISMHAGDHGDGRPGWVQRMLADEGIAADGETMLHAFPRVLGYAFKPVSFWFCHRADGALVAIVAEVNNTFGDRHCYLLANGRGEPLPAGATLSARKVFHVSPFCAIRGEYRFRFMNTARRHVARIDLHDAGAPLLQTSISGVPVPVGAGALLRALLAYPAFSLGVIARIHWQALRLWIARVPLHRRPDAPEAFTTRGHE